MIKKIAVVGATGMLGRPVTEALIAAGFDVTIIARNIDKARTLFPDSRIMQGDLQHRESLLNAFKNQDAIYLNLHVPPTAKPADFHAESDGMINVIEAARACALKRIAYISSLVHRFQGMNGFHWWVFDIKKKAVELIKSSGIPYTIFYPSSFMENFLTGMKKGNRIMMVGTAEYPHYWIAASDYAAMVVKSFQLLNDENREYPVQGPRAIRPDFAASIFTETYWKEQLKISYAPMGIMKLLSLVKPEFKYFLNILTALNKYPERFESELTWQELGKPAISLEEFAKES
ncbi:MAG: NAD(P)H-binding protein [bacterium]